MREQQFIRFVEEICYLLKLSQPCSKTALQYFMQFKEYENHGYDQEILVAACIYLSVKIFEEEVRIRDILNMVYVLTSLYRLSAQQACHDRQSEMQKEQNINDKIEIQSIVPGLHAQQQIPQQSIKLQPIEQKSSHIQQPPISTVNDPKSLQKQAQKQEEQPYILLKNIQNLQNLQQLIQPKYSLSEYNEYKGKIIQAEQMLLRILGFSFRLSQQNQHQLKRLLIIIHHLRIPPTIAQTIINVYNDLHYINIQYWPEGIVYFGYLIGRAFAEQKQSKKSNSTNEIVVPDNTINLESEKFVQDLQLKQFKSTGSQKKLNDKETAQLNRINEFATLMTIQKWQTLLATEITLLDNYAEKLANFYSSINLKQ